MNLLALRTEVFGHGFDQTQFPISRVNQYLNDAYRLIVRRVDYVLDEFTVSITTKARTAFYAAPDDFARERSVIDTDRQFVLQPTTVNAIDSHIQDQGAPYAYLLQGGTPLFAGTSGITLRLYPTPDGVYNLSMRYWKLPALLVNDTDVPNLPDGWHHLLWRYAVAECFKSEDDLQTGNAWMQDFNTNLSEFAADVKFPSGGQALQAQSMWESDSDSLGSAWGAYLGG